MLRNKLKAIGILKILQWQIRQTHDRLDAQGFNNQSGYGFIYTSSTGDEDVFVHHSALVTSAISFAI